MLHAYRHWTALALIVVFPSLALALPPALVQQGRNATALVDIRSASNDRVFGTAFCIDAGGLFVTNAHVADAAAGGKISLIVMPGEAGQRVVPATVVKSDRDQDLALLQADGAGVTAPLILGDAAGLFDTMDVTAFGFPFGNGLALNATEYPSISISTGHVTSLRKSSGVLELIQLDAVLNPGNSGGPVLDPAGHVVGIVQAGVRGAGINFAIPVSRLQKLLSSATVTIAPVQPITYEQRWQEHQLVVRVLSLARPAPIYSIDLTLGDDNTPRRTYVGATANGVCTMSVVPCPRKTDLKSVLVSARFSDGVISGRALNKSVKVGEQSIALSSIQSIRLPGSTAATVCIAGGKDLTGPVQGLEAVGLTFGPMSTTINLAKALSLTIDDGERAVGWVPYKLTVRESGKVVAEATGVIEFSGAPQATVASAPNPAAAPAAPPVPAPPPPTVGRTAPPAAAPGLTGIPVKTTIVGGSGGGDYVSMLKPPQQVVGFRCKVGNWSKRSIINTFDCLYDRLDAGQHDVVVGKPGYVVGGILADTDVYVHAVRIIFMRERNGQIDPKDRYVTPWIGVPASGGPPKLLAGHGEHVVGVCGHKGMNYDAIGLMIIPADR